MSKKRVHEIAKEQGIPSKELLERLRAAGVEVKAVASSIEETVALRGAGTATVRARRVPRPHSQTHPSQPRRRPHRRAPRQRRPRRCVSRAARTR